MSQVKLRREIRQRVHVKTKAYVSLPSTISRLKSRRFKANLTSDNSLDVDGDTANDQRTPLDASVTIIAVKSITYEVSGYHIYRRRLARKACDSLQTSATR